jgi:hypothetical protein
VPLPPPLARLVLQSRQTSAQRCAAPRFTGKGALSSHDGLAPFHLNNVQRGIWLAEGFEAVHSTKKKLQRLFDEEKIHGHRSLTGPNRKGEQTWKEH